MSGEMAIIANVVAVRREHAEWADSSAGEHLPYTQGVVGSKPIPPTIRARQGRRFDAEL